MQNQTNPLYRAKPDKSKIHNHDLPISQGRPISSEISQAK